MSKTNYHKHQFIYAILAALHLQIDRFMYRLVHCQPYEMIIYHWIMKLYDKGKAIDDTIDIIYKARNMFLLKTDACVV